MSMFENHKERIVTGLALLAAVFVIGLIDNFFVMWLVFGGVYILAFKEAVKLFEVENDGLLPFAIGIWLVAGVYPYGDDLFVLAGVAYASAVAFN
ncbi:MAG TPA: phosphatidate cytidylyltransferase, partial [Sulfurimonas sp.]|nr:phosphatidate cytidylyltransferase [Sulfurimonas sp.]